MSALRLAKVVDQGRFRERLLSQIAKVTTEGHRWRFVPEPMEFDIGTPARVGVMAGRPEEFFIGTPTPRRLGYPPRSAWEDYRSMHSVGKPAGETSDNGNLKIARDGEARIEICESQRVHGNVMPRTFKSRSGIHGRLESHGSTEHEQFGSTAMRVCEDEMRVHHRCPEDCLRDRGRKYGDEMRQARHSQETRLLRSWTSVVLHRTGGMPG